MNRRAATSQRAVHAAVAVARAHGLRVDEPVVLHDVFSTTVHLRPAPVVARVPTWIERLRTPVEAWIRKEIALASFLAAQGAPVVTPSAELPPGPHDSDGLAVSFWTYVQPDPERTPTAADCSAMLPDLHAALRAYPADLPTLDATVIDLPRWFELLDHGADALSDADIELLHASAARLEPFLEACRADSQPLHGDAHPGNLIATRTGLLWLDFEEVCLGPAEWDYATIGDPTATTDRPDLDPARLELCRELRALQVALCLIALRDVFTDLDGWDAGIRATLEMLASAK